MCREYRHCHHRCLIHRGCHHRHCHSRIDRLTVGLVEHQFVALVALADRFGFALVVAHFVRFDFARFGLGIVGRLVVLLVARLVVADLDRYPVVVLADHLFVPSVESPVLVAPVALVVLVVLVVLVFLVVLVVNFSMMPMLLGTLGKRGHFLKVRIEVHSGYII